jgi:hypothetical protein
MKHLKGDKEMGSRQKRVIQQHKVVQKDFAGSSTRFILKLDV